MAEAETRFERDLREMLAADLEAVHGPHPRWADAPVARRVGRVGAPPSRRPAFAALAVLAAVILFALVIAVVVFPQSQPVATQAATLQPLPASVDPSAFPAYGELGLGTVGIVTQQGKPALVVRAMTQPSAADQVVVRIDIRVVGPVTTAVTSANFGVLHDNQRDPLPLSAGADPLAVPVGAAFGTTVSSEFTIPVTSGEWADLAYYETSTPAFTYPIHRPAALTPPASSAQCPTIADYTAASAQPSDAPPPIASFAPADIPTQPTTGTIQVGTVGALAAPDGSVGALVRVSNVRFCDRLPNARPDEILGSSGVQSVFLLSDLDLRVIKDGSIDGWIPGEYVQPVYRGYSSLSSLRPGVWYPGANWNTSLATGAGFQYHGTLAWVVPGGDGQLTVGVSPTADPKTLPTPFQFAVREGPVGRVALPTPPMATPLPTLTAAQSALPLDTTVVVNVGPATAEVQVGRVQQVDRYPGLVPQSAGDVFLEFGFRPIGTNTTYTWRPDEWVLVKPDGTVASPLYAVATNPDDPTSGFTLPDGWPDFVRPKASFDVPPNPLSVPIFQVAEVPATGRITLEYRPNGGPAVATWVLREQ
jgi:hypothetical protein